MGRFLGTVDTALTFSVLSATALDPRVVVDTKEELTKAETWPQSGESVYVYDGQTVYVKSEQCAYALVDKNNYTDVNSWKYVGGYEDIYAYDIKSEAIQDASKIATGELTFDMISNTTTVSGIYYDENYKYFYRTVQIGGATGSIETQYYLTWGDLGDNIIASEILGEVKDGKTYPKANTTYYCEYQDADGKQDFTIPSDFNGFVPGKLYISVLNGKMYKASGANSLITVSGGDSSYLLNRLIALEKAGAEDDVLEFNGMVNTEDIVESSVAANNYTIMFDTHNKQFVAYENGVYYANWKENDFNKPSTAYGEKMYSGIKPTAGKIYIDVSTNQIYRWNGVDLIALNATADSIKIGKNDDGNTYKIALNSDGSGHLANKGIEWDADGDVTFGQNVTLNWSNIENPPTPPAGEGTFKSTVFTRTNATPDTPTGGSYNNPKPDGDIWSDSIPDGDAILWASTRVFSTLGENSELAQTDWTTPKKMTDTASFNVEFSKSETPKAPTDFIDGETEEQWRANNPDWENTSDEDTIWMATNTRKNGVWDGWQVSKIKGEKGDNGTSISIKKKANIVESIEKLPTSATIGDICFVGSIEDMDNVVSYVYQENGWVAQTGMQLGDSYLVNEWLFMWDGDSWIKSQFKGDPGKSSYIHIKYANSENPGDWTGRGNEPSNSIIPDDKTSWGETPGTYMGVYSDNIETDSKNWDSYKWTKWEGQDGMGYEYVYRTTTTNKAPELSENEYTKNEITYNPSNDGFIPENWSDDPISISSENPFCWMAVRQKLDGKWSSFKVSLWSKWGFDSIKLDLDNDNDSIMYRDNTPISTVVSNATLYDGVTPVTTGVVYSVTDWGTTVGSLDKNQITITSIGTSSTSVKIRAEYKKNEYFATLSIKKLVNTDKYEIICLPNAIPHNISNGDSQHTILINTYKTDFETGTRELLTELPEGYTLICDINDNNISNDNVTIVNNQYILDITDTNKPDSLTFILKKGEDVLDSETIPVNYTKNGEDGIGVASIKTQYAISNDPINHPDEKDENWTDNSPTVNKDSQYLWRRLKTIYTNNTESDWSYNVIGRMGEKGENGENVVTYEIVPTNSYYIVDPNKNSENINCVIQGYLYKIDGNSRTIVPNAKLIGGYSNTIDGNSRTEESTSNTGYFSFGTDADNWPTSTDTWDDDNCLNSLSYIVRYEHNSKILAQYSVNMAKNGVAGTAGKQSAPLRVSEWAAGTTYYSGYEENAPWSDTVIYKDSASNTKQYYRCMKFHIAEDENAPGVVQSDNTKYWELYGGKFESIATGLLLAEKAYIDNLGVRSLSTNVTGERFTATGTEIAFYGKREYPAMRMSVDASGRGRLEFLNQDTGEVTYVINEEGIKKWEEIINTSVNEIISPAVTTYRMIGLPDGSDLVDTDWANYDSNIFKNDTTSATDLYKYVAGRNSAGEVTETKYCISVEFSKESDGRYFIFKPTDTQLLGSNAGSDGVTRKPYTGFFVKSDNVIHAQIRAYTNCTEGCTESIPDDYNEYNEALGVDWSVVETYNDPNWSDNGFRYKNPIQDTYVYRMYNGEFVNANEWDNPDPTVGQTPLHVYRNKYKKVTEGVNENGVPYISWEEWDNPTPYYVYKDDSKYGYPI